MFQHFIIKRLALRIRFLMKLSIELLPHYDIMIPIAFAHAILIIVGVLYSGITAIDFKVYYEAAICRDIGSNPWQFKLARISADSSILPFLYPPLFFVFFRPFLFLDFTSAYVVWVILMELLLIPMYFLLALSARDVGIDLSNRNKGIILSMLLLTGPTMEAVLVGQVQILTALLLLIYWYSLSHRYSAIAGMSLALACIFKPFVVIVMICALWFKEWLVIHYFILTIVFMFFASMSIGIEIREYVDYSDAMRDFSMVLDRLSSFDLSPSRFYIRSMYIFDQRFASVLMALSFFIVCLYKLTIPALALSFVFSPVDSIRNRMLASGIFGLLLPLCSPIIWGHYFIWSLFAYIVVIISLVDCKIPDRDMPRFRIIQTLKILCILMPLGNFYSCVYPILSERDLMAIFCLLYWPCIILTALASAIYYIPLSFIKAQSEDVRNLY